MTILLAAIDDSAACRPILEVAIRVAKLIGADPVAVHVQHLGSGPTARATAQSLDVPLFVRDGDTVEEVCAARDQLKAVAVAVGTRSLPGGRAPAGHVPMALARQMDMPLIVVPPETVNRQIERIVVALDGNVENKMVLALAEQLSLVEEPEIVAVHVFRPEKLPSFGDDPTFETEVWAREFLRHMTSDAAARVHLDLRVGDPAIQLSAAVRDLDADLIVLAWHRNLSEGHAEIVRRVLETVPVPLVLLDASAADVAAGRAQERQP